MSTPRIGVIGTGNMGRIHSRVLGEMRMLAGVADINLDSAMRVGELYKVPAFEDYNTMIVEASLDGVIISTPTFAHAKVAEDIAKKHPDIRGIMIEKPLASGLKEAERVAKILKEKKIPTVVAHTEIYNPIVRRAISLINEGAIGTPRNVIYDRRGFVQPSRVPSLGDVFEDLGVHDFDIMTRISEGPAKVYAQARKEGGVYNAGTVLISFENGSEHCFHLSREYAGRARMVNVSGNKGALILDLFAQIIYVKDLDQEPSAEDRTIKLPERGATIKVYGEPVREVLMDFIKVMENGSSPLVSLDDGIIAMKVIEAARESARTGKVLDINVTSK
ncbi:MAG: Gfo/Idh/MocA family protein [Candidatus Thorarchaeota archaeon]